MAYRSIVWMDDMCGAMLRGSEDTANFLRSAAIRQNLLHCSTCLEPTFHTCTMRSSVGTSKPGRRETARAIEVQRYVAGTSLSTIMETARDVVAGLLCSKWIEIVLSFCSNQLEMCLCFVQTTITSLACQLLDASFICWPGASSANADDDAMAVSATRPPATRRSTSLQRLCSFERRE